MTQQTSATTVEPQYNEAVLILLGIPIHTDIGYNVLMVIPM